MIKIRILFFCFLCLLAVRITFAAENLPKKLKTLTEQFQKNNNDSSLQEKLIKLAQKIKPPPAVPEEATRLFEKANILQQSAKDTAGYDLAVAGFRDAIKVAPWWGDAYFNLALALDAAEKYDEAIATLKLYQHSIDAESSELRDIQNKIYSLEAKIEKTNIKKDIQIIAGQSIGKLAVGMPADSLRGVLGEPSKSENVGPWWQNMWWKKTGLMTSVKMSLGKVDAVQVTEPAKEFKTAEGIGLGSPENTVQPKLGDADRSGKLKTNGQSVYCYRTGLKVTATNGKVTAIEVFRANGFDETYCESRLFE